jgi:hypothetical protein
MELTFLISVLGLRIVAPLDADRDVGIAAQVALFHVGFRDTHPAQQLAQTDQVLGGFVRGAQVWGGDHFDQRDPAAVEVDQTAAHFILGLAGIFFDVQLPDAHVRM